MKNRTPLPENNPAENSSVEEATAQLYRAIATGDLKKIDDSIRRGAQTKINDGLSHTAVGSAMVMGNLDVLNHLYENYPLSFDLSKSKDHPLILLLLCRDEAKRKAVIRWLSERDRYCKFNLDISPTHIQALQGDTKNFRFNELSRCDTHNLTPVLYWFLISSNLERNQDWATFLAANPADLNALFLKIPLLVCREKVKRVLEEVPDFEIDPLICRAAVCGKYDLIFLRHEEMNKPLQYNPLMNGLHPHNVFPHLLAAALTCPDDFARKKMVDWFLKGDRYKELHAVIQPSHIKALRGEVSSLTRKEAEQRDINGLRPPLYFLMHSCKPKQNDAVLAELPFDDDDINSLFNIAHACRMEEYLKTIFANKPNFKLNLDVLTRVGGLSRLTYVIINDQHKIDFNFLEYLLNNDKCEVVSLNSFVSLRIGNFTKQVCIGPVLASNKKWDLIKLILKINHRVTQDTFDSMLMFSLSSQEDLLLDILRSNNTLRYKKPEPAKPKPAKNSNPPVAKAEAETPKKSKPESEPQTPSLTPEEQLKNLLGKIFRDKVFTLNIAGKGEIVITGVSALISQIRTRLNSHPLYSKKPVKQEPKKGGEAVLTILSPAATLVQVLNLPHIKQALIDSTKTTAAKQAAEVKTGSPSITAPSVVLTSEQQSTWRNNLWAHAFCSTLDENAIKWDNEKKCFIVSIDSLKWQVRGYKDPRPEINRPTRLSADELNQLLLHIKKYLEEKCFAGVALGNTSITITPRAAQLHSLADLHISIANQFGVVERPTLFLTPPPSSTKTPACVDSAKAESLLPALTQEDIRSLFRLVTQRELVFKEILCKPSGKTWHVLLNYSRYNAIGAAKTSRDYFACIVRALEAVEPKAIYFAPDDNSKLIIKIDPQKLDRIRKNKSKIQEQFQLELDKVKKPVTEEYTNDDFGLELLFPEVKEIEPIDSREEEQNQSNNLYITICSLNSERRANLNLHSETINDFSNLMREAEDKDTEDDNYQSVLFYASLLHILRMFIVISRNTKDMFYDCRILVRHGLGRDKWLKFFSLIHPLAEALKSALPTLNKIRNLGKFFPDNNIILLERHIKALQTALVSFEYELKNKTVEPPIEVIRHLRIILNELEKDQRKSKPLFQQARLMIMSLLNDNAEEKIISGIIGHGSAEEPFAELMKEPLAILERKDCTHMRNTATR